MNGLASLKIIGIFDRQDVLFRFDVSPFFLVGPNGTGKSTALKILHNILTAQWDRLEELPVNGVEIALAGSEYYIDKGDFSQISRLRRMLARTIRRPRKFIGLLPTTWKETEQLLRSVAFTPARTSPTLSDRVIQNLSTNYEAISGIVNFVEATTKGRVLYFPTYRRVERDLKELLEEDSNLDDELPDFNPVVVDRFQTSGEVVGFGGQDIKALIENTALQIDSEARQALNDHSVRFLQTISIAQKVADTKELRSNIQSKAKVERLLSRVSTFAPTSLSLDSVRDGIERLSAKVARGGQGRLNQREETMLIYVGELIKLFDRIDNLLPPLRQFSNLITKYLKPIKTATLRESDNRIAIYDASNTEIQPDQLSSGEKQILAFFAFLLLKDFTDKRVIIIDEPELSLSVSWQKSLIQDIIEISPNSYLLAATHSPFIFEDFSLDNVKSLGIEK